MPLGTILLCLGMMSVHVVDLEHREVLPESASQLTMHGQL
jgi:hypothetical protein